VTKRLRIPVLEPDGHGGARIRTERRPTGPRRPRTRAEELARGSDEPWRRDGYGKGYRDARQECMARARGRCERCGRQVAHRDCSGRWVSDGGQTHHVDPLRSGGGGDRPRLALLCPSCHALADAELRRREGHTRPEIENNRQNASDHRGKNRRW